MNGNPHQTIADEPPTQPPEWSDLRVCILCVQYYGWGKIGGFGIMSRTLAEALAAREISVEAIVVRGPGQPKRALVGGVDVKGFAPLDFRGIRECIKASSATIFHSQEPSILTALAQSARPDAVHVVTCRDPRSRTDWLVEFATAHVRRKFRVPLNYAYEAGPRVKRAVRHARAVYTPAHFLQEKVQRMYHREDVGVLPNLVQVPAKLPEKSERPTFLFVGRLDGRKRPARFLELARRFPEAEFVVVGKAESNLMDDRYRNRYGGATNIRWEGAIDQFQEAERLATLYGNAWALVNTAVREGLPLTFIESLAQGTPIISKVDPDGFASQFGLVVADGDYARAIRTVLDRPDAMTAKGFEGHAYVAANFSFDRALQAHLDVYIQSTSSTRKPVPGSV